MESLYKKYNEKKFYEKDAKQIRLNFLQREYDSLTELFQSESNDLPRMRKYCGIEDTKAATQLIEELYYDICYSDEYNFKKNKLMKITDIIHDCIHRIYIKEEEVKDKADDIKDIVSDKLDDIKDISDNIELD